VQCGLQVVVSKQLTTFIYILQTPTPPPPTPLTASLPGGLIHY